MAWKLQHPQTPGAERHSPAKGGGFARGSSTCSPPGGRAPTRCQAPQEPRWSCPAPCWPAGLTACGPAAEGEAPAGRREGSSARGRWPALRPRTRWRGAPARPRRARAAPRRPASDWGLARERTGRADRTAPHARERGASTRGKPRSGRRPARPGPLRDAPHRPPAPGLTEVRVGAGDELPELVEPGGLSVT